jgi:lipoate-protein ligase A
MQPIRLIFDPPAPGSWNMAVDEALLSACSKSAATTLRVYTWSTPTLSLGYFQPYAERHTHTASAGCAVVRRATGGGAILHDQEMTYSLTTPVRDRNGEEVQAWYDVLHRSLVATLAEYGVQATLCEATDRQLESRFLCFQRRSEGDILLDNMKIAGSAQRRQRQAVLQHGSLLIRRSTGAPELPGIVDLRNTELAEEPFAKRWVTMLGKRLDWAWRPDQLTNQEYEQARSIQQEKFGHSDWTLRR